MQAAPHIAAVENSALIDLAAQAPAGSEIHKDRTALRTILLDGCTAILFPACTARPTAGASAIGIGCGKLPYRIQRGCHCQDDDRDGKRRSHSACRPAAE